MMLEQKTRAKRWLVVGALVLLLAMTLASCGGQAPKKTLSKPQTITEVENGGLSGEKLNKVADMLISVYDDKEYDVQDMLIAAKRGYDMTAEGFNDANVKADGSDAQPEKRAEFARNVLRQANGKATDATKIGDDVIAAFNEYDLDAMVKIFQTTVDTAAKGGFFDRILSGIGVALRWITRYLGFNRYILGICVFAIAVEILMIPFAIKQQKNSIKQANLRPKEMAIRNKYKGRNDQATQQKVQQEIQDLYQRENFSPFSGCLPLLLQMPILIALYNVVMDPLHYMFGQAAGVSQALSTYYTASRAAGGLGGVLSSTNGTIELLSKNVGAMIDGIGGFEYFSNSAAIEASLKTISPEQYPNFNIFGLNFGFTPGFDHPWLLLVPVITFVVYFFSMRLSRKFMPQSTQPDGATDRQTACSNNIMDISMPAMSTFFAFALPAIIGVYWIFRSVLGTLKQFIMSRVMPLPTFTEEDYKAAAKEMAGKAPKVQKSARAGSVRSLHHIDDEDYDDTRERALRQKAAMEEHARLEQEEKAKKSPFDRSEMKEERKDESEAQVPFVLSKKKKKKEQEEDSEAPTEENKPENEDRNDQE